MQLLMNVNFKFPNTIIKAEIFIINPLSGLLTCAVYDNLQIKPVCYCEEYDIPL